MKRTLFATLPLIFSATAFATIVHVDHVFVKVAQLSATDSIPGKLKIEHGHMKNNQCVYDLYTQQTEIVPLEANKLMTFKTKDTDISGDAGRGFTCMRYTLSLKGHQYTQKVADPFILKLDNNGNYISSAPYGKIIYLKG